MRNLILTCCDRKYGDFLIEHWLASLKATTKLDDIDVVVIDYGLSDSQRRNLVAQGVKLVRARRGGHPGALRTRDSARYLATHRYSQVLICDGGDLIFQKDVRQLLTLRPKEVRAVCEKVSIPFESLFLDESFGGPVARRVRKQLVGKPLVNSGVIVGPYAKMRRLFIEAESLISHHVFGADQLVINYILHRDGYYQLPLTYNFVISTSGNFKVEKGVFYDSRGERIAIVHNTGRINALRAINDFGFGPDRNRHQAATFPVMRRLYRVMAMKRKK